MHAGKNRAFPVAALMLALLLLVPMLAPLSAPAIVQTPIGIDGDMADWSPVFMDTANTMADRAGTDDPDDPGTQSRDLSLVAYTWDPTYVYFYFRRTTQGTNSLTYNVYIDRDNDGRLESTDMVVRYTFNGTAYQNATLNYYTPSAQAGDPMGGDGVTPPGSQGAAVGGGAMTGTSAANGIEMECRLSWTALALTSGAPIGLHFATGRNAPLPGAIEDNTGNLTMLYRKVTVTPDNNSGTRPGTTLRYAHTIANGGNATETFDLTAISSQGWVTRIYNSDGTEVTATTLEGKTATSVVVEIDVPAAASSTARDVTTLRAVSRADPAVADSADDETMVGLITVSPYRRGGMAESGEISFQHTLSNNSTQPAAIDLSVISQHGWTAGICDESGTPLATVLLSAGATMTITAKIVVPVGAAIGTVELDTIRALLQSDPTVEGIAYDTVTVQKEVSISPSNAGPGGPGTIVQYAHTVINSWNETRKIDLAASSSRGWQVTIFDEDMITQVTSVTLSPFGGSRTVYVRIAIPGTATSGTVDTTTVRASFGGASDTATDVTTVSRLITYDSPGYVVPSADFLPGDTVYARGMGLTSGSQVRFRWTDASGTVVYTTPPIGVDVTRMCASQCSLPSDAALGTWTLTLLDNGGGVIAQTVFRVNDPAYLTLTIDTSLVDFGTIDPGTPVPPRVVGVTVDSSKQYTITPTITGDVAPMGFSLNGQANGLKPAGTGHFFDDYQIDPPWTADPEVPLNTSVLYTVVQQ